MWNRKWEMLQVWELAGIEPGVGTADMQLSRVVAYLTVSDRGEGLQRRRKASKG